MGYLDIKECVFTNMPAVPIIDGVAAIEYTVLVNGKRHLIRLSDMNFDRTYLEKNKDLLFALLYNDDWFEDEEIFIKTKDLQELIASKSMSSKPEDKLQSLFFYLFSQQKVDGEKIVIDKDFYDNILWKILYFKSNEEMTYYLQVLDSKGLINGQFDLTQYRPNLLEAYDITYEGLNYAIKLNTEGDKSNKCFVAMAFDNQTIHIREAIKAALKETGFVPIIIDEENIDSDKTINDEIIAGLKRCKFCIADFTLHRNGVYFESGFALGQGKKVIYTCQQDEFAKAHFDIKPLQHIIYENPAQLKSRLITKIEAWIK